MVDPGIERGRSSPDGVTGHGSSPWDLLEKKEGTGNITVGMDSSGVTWCGQAMARDNRRWWSSTGRRLERGGSEWHSTMEPGNDGGALGVLYIGWGGEVRDQGGRAVAGDGFSLPLVSWSKRGKGS
jgi:hypothetical protein